MKSVSILVTIIIILLTGCKKNNPPDISNDIKIYSIFPTQGLPNTTVVIKGINFNDNASDNLVKFNSDLATVVLASKDSLIVTAPMNGTTGPVDRYHKWGNCNWSCL